jgi:hypothetical protein
MSFMINKKKIKKKRQTQIVYGMASAAIRAMENTIANTQAKLNRKEI